MSHRTSKPGRTFLLPLVSALLLAFLSTAAGAVEHEVRILMDLDDDSATGCLVNTVEGPLDGVDQILITTVDTSSPPEAGTVTDVATSDCIDEGTDTFSAPASFDGGWPVGIGNGVGGRDVVETYFPLVASVVESPTTIRLGVVVTDENGGEQALLTTEGTPDGEPIRLFLGAIIDPAEIPTLGEWALILLALLLAGLSVRFLGRRGSMAMVAVLALLAAGVAWAAVSLDGLTTEWSAGDQLGSNGIVLFGMVEGDNVCFRVDVDLIFNSGPEAADDAYATDEDSAIAPAAPGVLGNDSDPDSDPLTVSDHDPTSAQGAVVNVSPDGSFSYDPTGAAALQALDDGESVDDTFGYTASDGTSTDTATVTVTVDGVNDAPTAMDDMFMATEDTPLVIAAPGVLVNDDDVDGETITAVLDSGPSNASTFILNADGSFSYTPAMDFNGVDSFTYHATDGDADSAVVTVTISVGAVNDGPNAVDDTFMTGEDAVLNEPAPGVLMNDTDPENDPLTVTAFDATSTQGASVNVNADGSFSYDPTGAAALQALDDGEMVDDTFTYTIDDGSGNPDTATVTVTVNGANDAPVAVDDAYATDEDVTLNVPAAGVLGNDTDVDVETLTAVLVSGPSNADAFVLNADGSFSYTPAANYNGPDSFTYRANDGTVSSNIATVTITVNPVNDPPVADDETFTVACNLEHVVEAAPGETAAGSAPVFRTLADNVLAGDGDPVEGTAVAIVQADGATSDTTAPFDITTTEGGTVTLHADGSFVYTPEGGDRGVADSFTYTIQDAEGAQDTATVTLNVANVCVWFVDNSVSGADDDGTGTSSDPFTSLVDELGPDALPDDAEDASQPGDVIYVFEGDSRTGDPYDGNFAAETNERILGQGVDLVVDLGGGPETLFTGNPANRPMVEGVSAGVAVSVIDVTGVEVAGLEMTGGDNSFTATSITAPMGFDLHDNVMTGASTGAIVIDQNGAFDSTATLTGNQVTSSTGNAIQVEVSAGTLELGLEENTGLTSTGSGIDLDGGGGSLYVTSFCGNTVSGDTSGTGIRMMDVIFDADPADMDFTGDEVGCTGTPTSVGSAANPVGGFALSLIDVTGDLAFGTLDLYTEGMDAVGLEVSGPGELNAGGGTGFEVTSTGGTISSTDGPAVVIDPATIGLTLTSITSTGSSTTGVSLVDVAGSFSATGGSISGATGNSFHIASTLANPLAVTYGGGITTNSAAMVNVAGHPGGTVMFTGNLSATGGSGIQLSNADGSYDFSGTVTLNGGDAGVDVVGGSSGSFSFADTDITNPSGPGIHVAASGPSSVTFGAGSQMIYATVGQPAVAITDRTAGVFTYSGTINATNGTGLQFSNDDGSQTSFNGSVNLNGGNAGIDIVNGSSAAYTFSNADITNPSGTAFNLDASGPSGLSYTGSIRKNSTGRLIGIDGHSGGAITFNGGTITQDVSTGTGVVVSDKTGGAVTFTSPIDLGPSIRLTSDAVTLANNSGGTTTFADLDVRTSNARGFVKTGGGSVTVTTGTVDSTGSFAGAGIDVSGGTSNLSFSDVDVTNNGAGGGVSFANSAGTKTLQALNVTTTTSGAGLFADTAGTLEVTGAANTISATNGTGVSIVDTTIGASDVTLRSVSSSGAANGIVLDTTGTTGEFMVTGDGSMTAGVLDRDGSGGAIGSTGSCISLTSSNGVTIRQLDMTGCGDHAVEDTGGSDHVLSAVTIQNPTNHGWEATNLQGVNRIDHGSLVTQFNGVNQDGVRLINTDTDFTSFTVDNVTFSSSATGNDGFFHRALGGTTGSIVVTGSTFTGLDADGVQVANDGSETIDTTIQGNSFSTADATGGDGNNGLALNLGGSGIHQFLVGGPNAGDENTFTTLNRLGDNSGVINVTAAGAGTGATSRVIGTIQRNSISDSDGRRGISVLFEASGGTGHGGHTIVIDDNDVNDVAREGIYVGMSSVAGRANTGNRITISNNNVGDVSVVSTAGNREGIEIEAFHDGAGGGSIEADVLVEDNVAVINNTDEAFRVTNDAFTLAGAATTTLDVTVLGNVFTNTGSGDAFELRSWDAGSTSCLDINAGNQAADRNNANLGYLIARSGGTFAIEGMGAGPNTDAQVNAFVDPRNDGGASAASGNGFTGGVTCSLP